MDFLAHQFDMVIFGNTILLKLLRHNECLATKRQFQWLEADHTAFAKFFNFKLRAFRLRLVDSETSEPFRKEARG